MSAAAAFAATLIFPGLVALYFRINRNVLRGFGRLGGIVVFVLSCADAVALYLISPTPTIALGVTACSAVALSLALLSVYGRIALARLMHKPERRIWTVEDFVFLAAFVSKRIDAGWKLKMIAATNGASTSTLNVEIASSNTTNHVFTARLPVGTTAFEMLCKFSMAETFRQKRIIFDPYGAHGTTVNIPRGDGSYSDF